MFKGGEGVKGLKAASISWYTALSKPLPLQSSTQWQWHLCLSEPMPSPRRVIESHTLPILLVAVFAAVAALEASKGSTLHESLCSPLALLAGGTLRAE